MAISSECSNPTSNVPPQPGEKGDRSSMMPAAVAGRSASISFAPELLGQPASMAGGKRAWQGSEGMARTPCPQLRRKVRQFDCVAPP